MPKNSSIDVLKRWRSLDATLACWYGLNVYSFSCVWGVSIKSVRRDLKAFEALGQRMYYKKVPLKDGGENDPYRWYYEKGVTPLFTINVGKKDAMPNCDPAND